MPRDGRLVQITRQNLTPLLIGKGPVSATELAAALRVNRSTITRALPDFGDDLVTLGTTRSTRYMLRRPLQNGVNRWPVYQIDESGAATHWATVESLYERRWRVIWEKNPPAWAHRFCDRFGLWQGFPFFLADTRPDGFLGRSIARRLGRSIGIPEDVRAWSDDHTLIYLHAAGEDVPGSLVVGDSCLQGALMRAVSLAPEHITPAAARQQAYPALARLAADSLPGSSAGGEQPKFLTVLQNEGGAGTGAFQPVLVKFSPLLDQPAARRWADLLLCEYHALQVLAQHGLAHPGAAIFDAGNRRFLEVPRFDRAGIAGRRGVVSLSALHPDALGFTSRTAWPAAAGELMRQGLIDTSAFSTIHQLHTFGELIGNSDMHSGNLAFWLRDEGLFRVAPAFDMLPMLWAPGPQGEIAERPFIPAPPLPAIREIWHQAAARAETFWEQAADDPRLSREFALIAASALSTLRSLRLHAR